MLLPLPLMFTSLCAVAAARFTSLSELQRLGIWQPIKGLCHVFICIPPHTRTHSRRCPPPPRVIRFTSLSELQKLDVRQPIKGLWLAGQDALLCGVPLVQVRCVGGI